jgi:hypothetical protein
LEEETAARRRRKILTNEAIQRQSKCEEVQNYRRRKRLPIFNLVIEDFMKCDDVSRGRKYPVRTKVIVERLGFVLHEVGVFADAEIFF